MASFSHKIFLMYCLTTEISLHIIVTSDIFDVRYAMDTQNQTAVKLFKALSDPNRLAILALLREGEKCACVLLERLELTQPGLSYHMKVLCGSGLVESRQEGKWTHYRLSEEGRRQAVALLLDLTTPGS